MLEWISSKYRDEKQKLEKEANLKQSLAEKVKRFQSVSRQEDSGYTELTVNGKRVRIAREHITIEAISPFTITDLA